MNDKCVSCGSETAYEVTTHIDMRNAYIEGLGQLCNRCYNSGKNHNQILVPENLIIDTPNDNELGKKVRTLYYETR